MLKFQEEISKFRWLLYSLPPALGITINIIMFGERYIKDWHILVFSTLLLISLMAILSPIQIYIANFMRKRQTSERKLIQRILLAAFLHFPVTAIIITLVFFVYSSIPLFQYTFSRTEYAWALFAGIVCDIIGIAMNEGIYSYHKWRETILKTEQLSKEKLQTQLNGLLQQINPHFLFNSLNALSALINENPNDAQKYLSDLSKVYRYLLRTNEYELTSLTNELNFIDSYFHLLQTRFGKGVMLVKKIDPNSNNALLPPLTLQLLVENAVKHNTVGKRNPLVIEIIAEGDSLMVRNNLQRKTIKVESSKIGLSNIAEKYRLINKSSIEIKEDPGFFMVKVPLINTGID
ncbi:histidine kinase [Flavihumibacter rivuli]|uniref:sensor histidine kinase n=1 Tax=Flavihumibacter rivuli TaxID=2838156 RepID=UPI001BDF0293|nr:sensor histidine kinase [Flavihumibacter rivuli]ULQ58310.1 histidine kinase [Flavihumibacter rivuli]